LADYTKFIEDQIKAGATLIIEDPEEYFGHTQASNILLMNHSLNDAEFRVYMVIRSFAYGQKIHCWPGQELIGQLVGKSRETVNRIVQKLEKNNLIRSVQRGLRKTNVYIIKKIPMDLVENHQKLLGKTGVNKPSIPCKSTKVTKTSHQEKPSIPYNSSEVTKTSLQEVTKTSHKEYKKNNIVVVVENDGAKNSDKETIQKPEQLTLPLESDKQISPAASHALNQETTWNPENIMNQVTRITGGASISLGFAKEIHNNYTQEKLSVALEELERQLNTGHKIKSIGRWLRYALTNNIEPDQPVPVRTQKRNGNNQPKKDNVKQGIISPQEDKKKALIQSLYMS